MWWQEQKRYFRRHRDLQISAAAPVTGKKKFSEARGPGGYLWHELGTDVPLGLLIPTHPINTYWNVEKAYLQMYKPSWRIIPCFHLDGVVSCRKSSMLSNIWIMNWFVSENNRITTKPGYANTTASQGNKGSYQQSRKNLRTCRKLECLKVLS